MKHLSRITSIITVISLFLSLFVILPTLSVRAESIKMSASTGSIMFIENVGQFDDAALFQVGGTGGTLWLAKDAIWISVLDSKISGKESSPSTGLNIKLSFPGSNPNPRLEPINRLNTNVSYFGGKKESDWRADVPVWGGVRYLDLYPGVDLEITSEDNQLVQRILVHDQKNLNAVKLKIEGVEDIKLADDSILLETSAGEFTIPLLKISGISAYDKQPLPAIDGQVVVSPFSTIRSDNLNSPRRTGLADLIYSTYLGGSNVDQSFAIAIDSGGFAYVTGQTASTDFPTTIGDTTYNGGTYDAFVAKLSANGSSLSYATFIGGGGDDWGNDIVVDSSGFAYIIGQTASTTDFPATTGDTTYNGGTYDAFVAKLSVDGSTVNYATLLGGSNEDLGNAIVVDVSGLVYVTGQTASTDFPATTGDTIYNGGTYDAFVAKLSADGSTVNYATFLGGSGDDRGSDIAVDTSGSSYVTGQTAAGFPATSGAYDTSFNEGTSDAFVVKLNSAGSALTYASYLGGENEDVGNALSIDTLGAVYITGNTNSPGFPVTAGGFDQDYNDTSNPDAYAVKLSADGSTLVYGTFLGGNSLDYGNDIYTDPTGATYILGTTNSNNFPITSWGYDLSYNGYKDVFLLKLNPAGSSLNYATYMGSPNDDNGLAIAVDSNGVFYFTGSTSSANFPTTPGAYDVNSNGGSYDAFVAKMVPSSAPVPVAAVFRSIGSQDGWILESTETSNVGGTLDRIGTTIYIGDGAQDKQYRAILSFNTAALPDNAIISRVLLKIRRQGFVGTNPFTILGALRADIRRPFFGTSIALQISDFQAGASKANIGTFADTPVNYWYSALIGSMGYPYVDKAGTTQFRLRFVTDDNNDNGADLVKFFSGNYATAAARPTLVITYTLP